MRGKYKWSDVNDCIERIIMYLGDNGYHGAKLELNGNWYYKNIYNLFGKVKYAKTKENIYFDSNGNKTIIDPDTSVSQISIKWKVRRR